MAAETAQWPSTVYCFTCVVHKDDALWADEVQKNAYAVSTDNDLGDDGIYYVNTDVQSNIDELAGLLECDSDA